MTTSTFRFMETPFPSPPGGEGRGEGDTKALSLLV
jgi:hypothetical protein